MMYLYAMYHVYGQNGDDEKSLESLYQIPFGYTGRNEDLVSYYKYTHEAYKEGREDYSITFDEYVKMYRKNRITPESFAFYKNEQYQYEPNQESTPTDSTTRSRNDDDYNIYGEYQPVETMTPEEMRAELEAILEQNLNSN